MVAFALLTVFLGALLGLSLTQSRQLATSRRSFEARVLARRAVTLLAGLPYDELLVLRETADPRLPGLEVPERFRGSMRVEVTDALPGEAHPAMLRVRVVVSWDAARPRATGGELSLDRLVAMPERGLVLDPTPGAVVTAAGWASSSPPAGPGRPRA